MKTIFFTSENGLVKNSRSEHKRSFSFWTKSEVSLLLSNKEKSIHWLSTLHERSTSSIAQKLLSLQ